MSNQHSAVRLPQEIARELYLKSFYKHPFIVNSDSVKSYILIKKIIDMIESEYGIEEFETPLTPYDIEISTTDDVFFDVEIINYNFDETQPESYNNSRILYYEFIIETMDENLDRVRSSILENICYTDIHILIECIDDDAVKDVIKADEIEVTNQSETTYNNDSCPICLEEYSTDVIMKVAVCGHCLCQTCWEHIIQSNKCLCAECRANWRIPIGEDEIIPYDEEDIIEMVNSDNSDALLEIIDYGKLITAVLDTEELTSILGVDMICENKEGFETPDKYRQRIGGGDVYIILFRRE